MIPTLAWVSANRARSDATRKSHASATSNPPVIATPLIAPISGVVTAGIGPRTVDSSPAAPVSASASPRVLPSSLRSSPAQKRRVRTGEDDRSHVVVGVEIADRPPQRPAQLLVQRVAGVGAVERDGRDTLVSIDEDDIGHEEPPGRERDCRWSPVRVARGESPCRTCRRSRRWGVAVSAPRRGRGRRGGRGSPRSTLRERRSACRGGRRRSAPPRRARSRPRTRPRWHGRRSATRHRRSSRSSGWRGRAGRRR